jgi:hypothetical protein
MTQPDAALPAETAALVEPTVVPASPARRNALAVLLGIVAKPRSTFAYLRVHGGWSWVWPLLLALLVTLTARLIAVPIERAQAQAALEALQAQLEEQDTPGGGNFTFSAGPIGGLGYGNGPVSGPAGSNAMLEYGLPLLSVLGQWLLAGLLLLALAWLLGGRPRAGAMLRMSAWAWLVPVSLRVSVTIAVMLFTGRVPVAGLASLPNGNGPVISSVDNEDLPPASEAEGAQMVVMGPSGAAGASAGAMYLTFLRSSFLGALNLYTLWALVLLAVGVATTARMGWLKATLATASYWAASLALAALPPVVSLWMMRLSGVGAMVPMP